MFLSIAIWRTRFASRIITFCLAATALLLASANVSAAAQCHNIHGQIDDHPAPGPTCTSPIGLCTQGTFSGVLQGDYVSIASTLNPTVDTPVTAVLLYTADTTLQARFNDQLGELHIKNAGAFHVAGAGEATEISSITGGTGAFAGASGVFFVTGTADLTTGVGHATYDGQLCLP
jgi:hypothetical protein